MYGKLSNRDIDQQLAGSRVQVSNIKKNQQDFVLWKPSSESQPGWESPWGIGRPGWHTECCVMSEVNLKIPFDIHGGGQDLLFPHHENEIAQSCASVNSDNPEDYAKYWIHNGFVTIDGEKMSKSLNNIILLNDLLKEHDGETIRLALLSSHYRKSLDWNDNVIKQSKVLLDKVYDFLDTCDDDLEGEIDESIIENFSNDLDIPKVLTSINELLKNRNSLNTQTISYVSSIDIPSDELISLSFGQSIIIDVTMDSLSFAQVSGYIDPVEVEIDSIEQEIDLPDEISDLNFSIINMDFSFQSNLMLPVFLNLELLSVNDETGESYERIIEDINITETPSFSIDSIEQLINIKPNRIIATGNAKVVSLNYYGYVSTSDSLSGFLTIAAPLAFEIDENSEIELDPEEFQAVEIDDLISAKLFFDYENNLELGADVFILMAIDTNYFNNGQSDTLARLTLRSSQSDLDSIMLDQSHFTLLAREGNYIKTFLNVLGNNNGPTRFLSTDTIRFSAYLKSEVIVDINPPD